MPQILTAEDIGRIFPELLEISDVSLRKKVAEIWCEIAAEMSWDDLFDIPSTKSASKGMLVSHVRGVTLMALSLCDVAKRLHGRDYDRDLLLAACLLHDASKPVESEPNPGAVVEAGARPKARPSRLGKNVQHGVYAAHKALEKGLPPELVNLIITHTHYSAVRGSTWEAAALFYADYADTDSNFSASGMRLYLQRWLLGA